MKIIQSILETAEEGDKVLISFPDVYSFYTVSSWLSEKFGEIFWILWTDAAVERINHFAKKYGFPKSGEALIISAEKDCAYLRSVEKLNIEEIGDVKNFIPENKIVISFGVNFLSIYGHDLSKAIEALIEIDKGILITAIVGKVPNELLTFHDVFIEIIKSEDSFIAYHNYIAKLTFSMKGGVTVVSDNLEH
ncbi:MAG: hypothetical protein NZ872_00240 [Archaeoglobaceae archaeon]|nr:hypothetical protein [Archaeoglobaceae archaeon]MDW8127629.1 hypothetical protein [Archaeoglobaceae archaeon]